ncbi:MAG: YwaF family protein [Clostridia bacterium]|nr:YwaF family protein [Clostridia bacterium]
MIKEFFYNLSQVTMEAPGNYGKFHLISFALMVLVTVLVCLIFKRCSLKTERVVVGLFWALIMVLEIVKQLTLGFVMKDGVIIFDYSWWSFPFQLCSTPLYTLPFAVFLKKGRMRDAFVAYSALFAIFGGIVVMVYPNDVFTTMTYLNYQTMIHHSTQIVTGVFLGVRYLRKFTLRFYLGAMEVFAFLSALALGMDLVIPDLIGESFNMFYISPKYPNHLPILSTVYASVPYPVFLIAYLVGFGIAAALIFGVFKLFTPKHPRFCHG